jgi:RNA polymerase sigma-70 factor (ECF subfamily)
LKPADEALLVRRAVQRDPAAYRRLTEAYLVPIYRHLFYRVSTAAEVEELTEQVFLTGWDVIGRYDPRRAPFHVWLYRLAQTLVTDHNRTPRVPLALADAEAGRSEADVVGAITGALSVAEIRTALAALSPEHQQVLVLRVIEGMSEAAASQILGTNAGVTRRLQLRALQVLGRILAARGTT